MITRRHFIRQSAIGVGALMCYGSALPFGRPKRRPSLVFVLADQWRAQDVGYMGNKDVLTPNIDQLANESIRFTHAVACMPVSTAYRASLLTGQYALTNGLFLNDVTLDPNAKTIGKLYKAAGYHTAYIGKWHVNGNGRSKYIPESHRQGFDYFKVLECTHNYNHSKYYDNNNEHVKVWDGYDVFAQTKDAQKYIEQHAHSEQPFVLFLSWGPPHNPYETAPEEYKKLYADKEITLRPNVPENRKEQAIKDIRGYYAHISALDKCVGDLQQTIRQNGLEEDTIFVFTSDHGDMLGSQGLQRKQKPWDESIMVPFLLKYPRLLGTKGKASDVLFNVHDIMPTLLSMSDISIPDSVEGRDISPVLLGKEKDRVKGTLIECITPFGEWERRNGGKEYRGVRTHRYTYVRDLEGPWLLYDNVADPYQMNNLVADQKSMKVRGKLDRLLMQLLEERNDKFLPGDEYIKQWGYTVNKWGTVDYRAFDE
ncbi:MAG: sulfatase [Bacteroidales bacterium]|jgi:arylsulfatase A-like enzyme|nr:sulfatase [Bacteroidales bacterium]